MRSLRSLAAKAFFWPGGVNFAQSPAAIYLGSSRRNWAQADQRVAAPPCPPQPLAKADFPLQIFKEPAPERRTNSILARFAGNASCKIREKVSRVQDKILQGGGSTRKETPLSGSLPARGERGNERSCRLYRDAYTLCLSILGGRRILSCAQVSRCFRWNKMSLPHCLKVPSANPEGTLKGVESIGFSDIVALCHNRWQRFCGRNPPSHGSYGEPSDRAPKKSLMIGVPKN